MISKYPSIDESRELVIPEIFTVSPALSPGMIEAETEIFTYEVTISLQLPVFSDQIFMICVSPLVSSQSAPFCGFCGASADTVTFSQALPELSQGVKTAELIVFSYSISPRSL